MPVADWTADIIVPPPARPDVRDVVSEHLALDALDATDTARAYREVACAALDELHAQRKEVERLRQTVIDLRDELRRYVALRMPVDVTAAETMRTVEGLFSGRPASWRRVQQ